MLHFTLSWCMGHTVHDSKLADSYILRQIDADQGIPTGLLFVENLSYNTVSLELLIKTLHVLSVSPFLVHSWTKQLPQVVNQSKTW